MVVTPEHWYVAFWLGMGVAYLAAQYVVIKWAVIAALRSVHHG